MSRVLGRVQPLMVVCFTLMIVGLLNAPSKAGEGSSLGASSLFASMAWQPNEVGQDETAEESNPNDKTSDPNTEEAETTTTEDETEADAAAAVEPSEAAQLAFAFDNLILFICAVLVLFMQAGFGMLEAGLNSAKNTVNILCKNLMDLSVGVLLFFLVGYGLMYPGDSWLVSVGSYGVLGFAQVGIESSEGLAIERGSLHPQINFLFQAAFAATAATIVSGAVAGRMKFSGYLIYSAVITGLIYPLSGAWKWGEGWLHELGFYDFAGSVLVHAVGGFAGLAGAIVLGPRLGRFSKDGKSTPIPGHNLTFAALGVFILWIGWYGFNPGSQLAFSDGANASAVMTIATNTTLSPAIAAVVSMVIAWLMFGKPDLTMGLNGALAGLVGITANCDSVTNLEAIIIGAVSGGLVVFGIILLDKLKIDDPVGAWPVHGLCGIWGGIATGIFGDYNVWVQLLGTVVICLWAFTTMLGVFLGLKFVGLLRVNETDEKLGLDVSEHGMQAYPGVPAMDH